MKLLQAERSSYINYKSFHLPSSLCMKGQPTAKRKQNLRKFYKMADTNSRVVTQKDIFETKG